MNPDSCEPGYMWSHKYGRRIYCLKASECHLPINLICASEKPLRAASEAAPILKLWDLYRLLSNPQKDRTDDRSSLAAVAVYSLPAGVENRGPTALPRKKIKSSSAFTGHTIGSLPRCNTGWEKKPVTWTSPLRWGERHQT